MNKKVLVSFCCSLLLCGCSVDSFAQSIRGTAEYQAAMQALAESRYQDAYDSLSPMIQDSRTRGPALVEMGRIRLKQAESEMSRALSHYTEAAEYMSGGIADNGVSGSEIPKVMYDLAMIYSDKLKNYVQAHELFAKIVEDYPTYMAIDKVYFSLATCEELMGMNEEAAVHYQKVVSDYAYSTYFSAAQEKLKYISSGTSVAEAAIESQEQIADNKSYTEEGGKANLDLGDMQADAGKYKQAAASYRKAIRDANSQEEGVEAYRKLVSMLDEKQKDYKAAAAAIEEMLEAYPNARGNEDMIYKLGQIYENDMDSMVKKVENGKVRYRKSDESSRKAIDYYDSVTDKYPDSQVAAEAFIRKGKIYEELKEYSEAKAEYERFIKEFPQHNDAPAIRNKLKDLEGY
ncbi:MAG: tetratricopeptide repeat protein [Candidatus Riflebacteria bacterium]|nr:tetratricopeptide repeat protein [Candidatus Riflebacteria bacterium]